MSALGSNKNTFIHTQPQSYFPENTSHNKQKKVSISNLIDTEYWIFIISSSTFYCTIL